MVNILLAILVIFLVASMLNLTYLFYILYVIFGIYLLVRFWTRHSLESVTFVRTFERHAFLNETISVKVTITNRSLLPVLWLRLHDRLPLRLISPDYYTSVLSLLPKEKQAISYEIPCRRRGYYSLGPLTIETGDVFGFEQLQRQMDTTDHLTVYPKIVPLEGLGLPSKSPFGHLRTKQRVYEDPSRVVGVRDYISGDSLRNINWKVSAATGQLQVKKYEPAMTLQTVIMLNLNAAEYELDRVEPVSELAITVAASVASFLVGLRQEVGLITNGRDAAVEDWHGGVIGFTPRKGRAHLMSILELLARAAPTESVPFVKILRSEAIRLPWGVTLVVVTPREREDLLDTLFALRRSGFNVVLMFVDNVTPFAAVPSRAKTLGFRVFEAWKEEDIDAWSGRERKALG